MVKKGDKGGATHFRKGGKSKKEEEEVSDFEEVAMSDSDVDMETSLVPRKKSSTAAMDLDDLMGDDNVEEEEDFIATANMIANKKHKKSGGFQSMGTVLFSWIYKTQSPQDRIKHMIAHHDFMFS